jgi:hypothetical protein
MSLKRALIAIFGFVLVACSAVGGSHLTNPPQVPTPTAALAQWEAFPAGQTPRPIVLFWELAPSGGGFTSDDAKLAAMCSKLSLRTSMPAGVPAQASATWPDGTTATYKPISAKEAFAAITKPQPGASPELCRPIAPLQITTVRFDTGLFDSDRGIVEISAWIFGSPNVEGGLEYPALPPSAFWKAAFIIPSSNQTASISEDGVTLMFSFYGAPDSSGPCGADYKGVVAESTSAVAVAIQELVRSVPNGPVACDAVAQLRTVTVALASPLGGRVVVDEAGNARPVCPAMHPQC